MKNKNIQLLFLGLALSLVMLLAACGSSEPEDRIFNLEIHDGALVQGQSPLEVKQDDEVTIVVVSDEHVSFHLHGYDIEQEAEPGAPTTLVFTANATGSFPFTIHVGGGDGEDDHGHDATAPGCEVSLPAGLPAPKIVLTATEGHDAGEIEATVELTNFILNPEPMVNEGVATGHWHLFIDGEIVGMYAEAEATVMVKEPGDHTFMATLSDAEHCEYGISAITTVHVEEGEHSDEDDHDAEESEIELGRLNVLP